jgi:hypothetical protein
VGSKSDEATGGQSGAFQMRQYDQLQIVTREVVEAARDCLVIGTV